VRFLVRPRDSTISLMRAAVGVWTPRKEGSGLSEPPALTGVGALPAYLIDGGRGVNTGEGVRESISGSC
jgi:hypothetical protein